MMHGLLMCSSVLLPAIIITCFLPTSYAPLTDSVKSLAKAIEQIAIDLGVPSYQEYLNMHGRNFSGSEINAAAVADAVASDISGKLTERYIVASRLVKAVEDNFESFHPPGEFEDPDCCKMTYLTQETYTQVLRRKVDESQVCWNRAPFHNTTDNRYITNAVSEVFKSNFKEQGFAIRDQYFGDTKGLYFLYPAGPFPGCEDYDPRRQAWYAQAISAEKVVLIVLDISYGMRNCRMVDADSCIKHIADLVFGLLKTLTSTDKMGFIAFASKYSYPNLTKGENCYSKGPFSTDLSNRNPILNYINNIEYSNEHSKYSVGIRGAMDFLGNFPLQDATYVVVFITAVDNSEHLTTNITMAINEFKAKVEELVMITYYFGKSNIIHATDHLKAMPYITGRGDFLLVSHTYHTNAQFGAFYTAIAKKKKNMNPVTTLPYPGLSNYGLLVAVVKPAFHKGVLVGVAGVNLELKNLLVEAIEFGRSRSYAFVIDVTGSVLSHPLLPKPDHGADHGAVYDVKIEAIEAADSLQIIFEKMKNRESGSYKVKAPSVIARGDAHRDGVNTELKNFTYYYRPVPETHFSVGVVVEEGDYVTNYDIAQDMKEREIKFTYHDIVLDDDLKDYHCKHFRLKAIATSSVIKLAVSAFKDSFAYQLQDETKDMVATYERIMKGEQKNTNFTIGVIESIRLLSELDDRWTGKHGAATIPGALRYMGTQRGILRVFPGIKYDKSYDPATLPWYKRAVSLPNFITVSPPYLDPFGAGIVVTVSQAILEPTKTEINRPFGVMAIDLPVNYFHSKFHYLKKHCDTGVYMCFITDMSGYIVDYPAWFDNNYDQDPNFDLHLAEAEGHIAQHLIQNEHMVPRKCVNVEVFNETLFYEFVNHSGNYIDRPPFYQYQRIPKTNLYLFRKNKAKTPRNPCHCRSTAVCFDKQYTCQCPCSKHAATNVCTGKLKGTHPTCSVNPKVAPDYVITYEEQQSLEPCSKQVTKAECSDMKNATACYGVVTCQWCKWGKGGKPIKPYCGYYDKCYFGEVGKASPYETLEHVPGTGFLAVPAHPFSLLILLVLTSLLT